jgi:hypothetical protein
MRLLLIFALLFASIEDSHARRRRKSSSSSSRSSGKSGGWETAAGVLYTNYNTKWTNLSTTEGGITESAKVDIEQEFDSGLAFVIETRSIENHSWGSILGIEYISSRKLKQTKFNSADGEDLGGLIIKCEEDCPKIQTTNLILNTFYQWEQFYIPFGLIYSINKLDVPDTNYEMKNAIGLNLGIGYKIDDRFLIEINSRAFNFEEKVSVGSDSSKTEGIASIVSLGLKALF